MIDWMLAGVLTAVLMAEVVDALALRQLARQCLVMKPSSPEERRLLRWYAQGFDDSRAITAWLTGASLLLALIALSLSAHPALIGGALLLAACAHGEGRLSAALRRRFYRAQI